MRVECWKLAISSNAGAMAPQDPAPLIAAGDVLLQMGSVNEAIVSYDAAEHHH